MRIFLASGLALLYLPCVQAAVVPIQARITPASGASLAASGSHVGLMPPVHGDFIGLAGLIPAAVNPASPQLTAASPAAEWKSAFVRTTAYEGERVNEDSVHVDASRRYFLVADGVGGAAAGEVASTMTRDVVSRELDKRLTPATTPEEAAVLLHDAATLAHQAIIDYADNHPEVNGMGTTLSAGILVKDAQGKNTLVTISIGDSSIFVRRTDRKLEPVSIDESYLAFFKREMFQILREQGVDTSRVDWDNRISRKDLLRAQEALEPTVRMDYVIARRFKEALDNPNGMDLTFFETQEHPRSNVTMNSLGGPDFNIGDSNVQKISLNPGDMALALSDGAVDSLGSRRLQAVARVSRTPEEFLTRTAAEAKRIAVKPKNAREKNRSKIDDISGAALLIGEAP